MNILLPFILILILVTIYIIVYKINQGYKCEVDVRGFVGNCEKCELFHCSKNINEKGVENGRDN
ncbi:MAG: hypothetical protein ACK5HS_03005 [Mycoplasmatales bacterium]